MDAIECEGEKMKKPIEQILPNPHRNFDIYPIGEAQVKVLMDSIADVGMFLGLPARKVQGGYEIACGHHRLEALKRVGYTHIDIAVNEYTDDDMLKIMIRENSTQRGNENFGAVLDSVGAVLVQCVKDVYDPLNNRSEGSTQNRLHLESGVGIGRETILAKEPSLSLRGVIAALSVFRKTDGYLKLLKKGGLPEEFHHLYDKPAITTIEAVAQFPKPAHAAAWVKGIDDIRFTEKITMEAHAPMIRQMIEDCESNNVTLSVKAIESVIKAKRDANLGKIDTVYDKEEKTMEEKADDIIKTIKSLKNKLAKFQIEKQQYLQDLYIEDMDAIITLLIDSLGWFKTIRDEKSEFADSQVIDIKQHNYKRN